MRRGKILLPMLLVALLAPISFVPAAQAQRRERRVVLDSGVTRLGSDQILRITIFGHDGNDTLNVSLRRTYYVGTTNGGIWKATNVVQNMTTSLPVAADEAVSIDINQGAFDAVRGEVIIRGFIGTITVNNGVLFQIIKASTGEIVSAWEDSDIVH